MDIFYYNTPIYKEILLKFLQSTEKYYVNRTPFHFRRRAKLCTSQHNAASKIGLKGRLYGNFQPRLEFQLIKPS